MEGSCHRCALAIDMAPVELGCRCTNLANYTIAWAMVLLIAAKTGIIGCDQFVATIRVDRYCFVSIASCSKWNQKRSVGHFSLLLFLLDHQLLPVLIHLNQLNGGVLFRSFLHWDLLLHAHHLMLLVVIWLDAAGLGGDLRVDHVSQHLFLLFMNMLWCTLPVFSLFALSTLINDHILLVIDAVISQ